MTDKSVYLPEHPSIRYSRRFYEVVYSPSVDSTHVDNSVNSYEQRRAIIIFILKLSQSTTFSLNDARFFRGFISSDHFL